MENKKRTGKKSEILNNSSFKSWEASCDEIDVWTDDKVESFFNDRLKNKLNLKRESLNIWNEDDSRIRSLKDLIKKIRSNCKLSKKDVSKIINVECDQYSDFENENVHTSKIKDIKFLVRILGFFNINLSKLVSLLSAESGYVCKSKIGDACALLENNFEEEFSKSDVEIVVDDLRPSLSEFFYKVQKEIKRQELYHLLPK